MASFRRASTHYLGCSCRFRCPRWMRCSHFVRESMAMLLPGWMQRMQPSLTRLILQMRWTTACGVIRLEKKIALASQVLADVARGLSLRQPQALQWPQLCSTRRQGPAAWP